MTTETTSPYVLLSILLHALNKLDRPPRFRNYDDPPPRYDPRESTKKPLYALAWVDPEFAEGYGAEMSKQWKALGFHKHEFPK